MMIQSNVNTKIENGEVSEVEARDWFKNSLSPVFENRKRRYILQGIAGISINRRFTVYCLAVAVDFF